MKKWERAFEWVFGDFEIAVTIVAAGTTAAVGLLILIYSLASCSSKTQPKTSAAKGIKLNLPPGDYSLMGNTINGVPGDTINIKIISSDTIKVVVK